jgi:hypothetical protein
VRGELMGQGFWGRKTKDKGLGALVTESRRTVPLLGQRVSLNRTKLGEKRQTRRGWKLIKFFKPLINRVLQSIFKNWHAESINDGELKQKAQP